MWSSSSSNAQSTSYTPAERKGEVNELRTALRDPATEKDPNRRRDLLKRVVAFMTLGIDTQLVFTEMIMASVTKDLVTKKMVYFYLTVHSETNSEIALLAVNTLQKDCKDESPLVRGLALRSLASLRLPQINEYLVPTMKQCLVDSSPYVRKTAILSTLRLYRVFPEQFRSMGLVDKMYGMLRDNDPLVAMNSLAVLKEVTVDDGGINVSKSILYFLLNRLREVPEWQQTQILELVLKYTPANEAEIFDIMNLLEERLLGNNSAVILSCTRVFLYLTQNLPAVHKQVFDRLKQPLLMMASSQQIEISYTVLCHVKLLIQREPRVFYPHFKDFYCRHTDPTFVKSIKMDILTILSQDSNANDIVGELAAYVGDPSTEMARFAVDTMCRVALKIDSSSRLVLEKFLELMTMGLEHIRSKILVVMKDFLRKYSDINVIRNFLDCAVKSYSENAFEDEDSKVALAWLLGEFGEHIEDAPYITEKMIGNFAHEPHSVRMELLTSCVKLFFKRPPEMQPILGQLFKASLNDFSHADVHDRALLYYRMLKLNPRAAAQVICGPKNAIQTFVEDQNADVRDKLFEEFDSLSVAYNIPSSQFMKNIYVHTRTSGDESESSSSSDSDEEGTGLLSRNLELVEDVELTPQLYKEKWGKISQSASTQVTLKKGSNTDDLQEALEKVNIMVLATGSAPGGLTKMYLFAQPVDNPEAHFLVEMLVPGNGGSCQITLKTDDSRGAEGFASILKKSLAPFT